MKQKRYSSAFNKRSRYYQLFLMTLPALIYLFIFNYLPMYGVQIAFKDFFAVKGIMGSPWVGLKHFERFFHSFQFQRLLKNTLGISIFQLLAGFPLPIILALLINQAPSEKFKKTVQTVTYAPHFISIVVMAGMIKVFLSPSGGLFNQIRMLLGKESILFLGEPQYFKSIYVLSEIWQNTGWGMIIYLAALSSVNVELYEAARIDGANKINIIKNIDFPSIMPTAIILLIMNMGRIMNVGFQKAFLLQNDLNAEASEIISTYVYKVGLLDSQFSYSTAIGLFNTLINIILLITVNKISKKLSETSLW